MNLQTFVKDTIKKGGASYNLATGQYNPTTGYMVAIQGLEERTRFSSSEFAIHNSLSKYIQKVAQNLCSGVSCNTFLGSWINDGVLYLDVAVHINDKESAKEFAKVSNQLALWDCANNCEILIKK